MLDYVRVLRELALESIHGNRSDASRLSAPASGRALELMREGLLWLADNLRVSYGEIGLLHLARMLVQASHRYPLMLNGAVLPPLDPAVPVSLSWPDWSPSTPADRATDAQTLATLVGAGLLSHATAVRVLAATYGVEDPTSELDRIKAEGTS